MLDLVIKILKVPLWTSRLETIEHRIQ